MFTAFLTATAAAVSAVMAALLLRRRRDVAPLRVPYGAVTVGATATGLVALGLWMIWMHGLVHGLLERLWNPLADLDLALGGDEHLD